MDVLGILNSVPYNIDDDNRCPENPNDYSDPLHKRVHFEIVNEFIEYEGAESYNCISLVEAIMPHRSENRSGYMKLYLWFPNNEESVYVLVHWFLLGRTNQLSIDTSRYEKQKAVKENAFADEGKSNNIMDDFAALDLSQLDEIDKPIKEKE